MWFRLTLVRRFFANLFPGLEGPSMASVALRTLNRPPCSM